MQLRQQVALTIHRSGEQSTDFVLRLLTRLVLLALLRAVPAAVLLVGVTVLSALAAQSDTTWSALRLLRVASHKLTGERR